MPAVVRSRWRNSPGATHRRYVRQIGAPRCVPEQTSFVIREVIHEFRLHPEGAGAARETARLLRQAHLSERAGVLCRDRAQSSERQRVAADRTDRTTETESTRRRFVEPVSA